MPNSRETPIFDVQFTEAICNVIAQTGHPGLSAADLVSALRPANLHALDDGPNKRTKLLTTLHNAQVRRGTGKTLVSFIHAAMNPSRYVQDHQRFEALRGELNAVLVLYGFRINEQGKLARGPAASTLSEAALLSGELLTELRHRGCHSALVDYCSEELVRQSLFHAVSEAAKSIPDRVRRHTGLGGDGHALYDQVFGTNTLEPMVWINERRDDSDISEHRGFKNLLIGIHGHYRNPRAHRTRVGSVEVREDFFDAFSLFSYVHRRLTRPGLPRSGRARRADVPKSGEGSAEWATLAAMAPIKALVRPELLVWARTSANLEPVAAARKVGVPEARLSQWEAGQDAPTVTELRKAAQVYNRSLAAFYLAEPPREFETLRDYRRGTPDHVLMWSGALHVEYRRAHAQREALLEIAELDGATPERTWRISPLATADEAIATAARGLLQDVAPRPPMRASATEYEHLNYWTAAVEEAGVLVMSTERGGVEVDEMRAFSLFFEEIPVVVLNGADFPRPRLFSLLHEYAHLLLHTSGICDTTTDQRATTAARQLEARCNAIAAAVLMPADGVRDSELVRAHPRGEPWTLPQLIEAAQPFGVSVEAFLRRLVTLGRVSLEEYHTFRAAAAANPVTPKKATGGDFYVTKSRDLGRGYVRAVTDAHRRALIDTYSAASLLDVKVRQMDRLTRAARI
ncbi:MAG: TIGR02391 family protein [Marmoricola sp.]